MNYVTYSVPSITSTVPPLPPGAPEPARLEYTRAHLDRDSATGDGPLVFQASSAPTLNRHGFRLRAGGWDVANFARNPVVLWAHDDTAPPIGRAAVEAGEAVGGLRAAVTFDRDDPFAATVEGKYRRGFLHAVSVSLGFLDAASGTRLDWWRLSPEAIASEDVRYDLAEISAVPVPSDPDALVRQHRLALKRLSGELAALVDDRQAAIDPASTITAGQIAAAVRAELERLGIAVPTAAASPVMLGRALASALSERINALVGEDRSRAEVVAAMAREAGIDEGTVNQILAGSINCPPVERLRGFARALNTSADDLIAAARRDGCIYEQAAAPVRLAAIPAHNTAVREGSGDCRGYVADAPREAAVLRHMHALVDSDGDPDDKGSYSLPHHPPQSGSAADLVCVRAALSRLNQTEGFSDAERAAARRHLERHLEAQNNQSAPAGPAGIDEHAARAVLAAFPEIKETSDV